MNQSLTLREDCLTIVILYYNRLQSHYIKRNIFLKILWLNSIVR